MRLVFLILLAFLVNACSSGVLGLRQEAPGVRPEEPPDVGAELYKIGPGDVLQVSVWGIPELSLSVPVRPDGYISIPLIGDIMASGFDAQSLADSITTALSDQLRDPQITVIVAQVNSVEYTNRVRITGAVMAPRSIQYARGMSVLDAVLEAGGLSEVASANRARLYREVDGSLMQYELRLDDILLRGNLETNYPIQPGDVITVPERLF